MDITVNKIKSLKGEIKIPADKSITHRAFMFSALTKRKCKISNFSKGADCMSTLKIIKQIHNKKRNKKHTARLGGFCCYNAFMMNIGQTIILHVLE